MWKMCDDIYFMSKDSMDELSFNVFTSLMSYLSTYKYDVDTIKKLLNKK